MPRLFPVIGGDGTLKVPKSVFLSERSRRRLFSFFKHGNWKPTNLTADDPRDHKCHRLPSVIERPPIDGRTGNLWKAYQSNRRWVWREREMERTDDFDYTVTSISHSANSSAYTVLGKYKGYFVSCNLHPISHYWSCGVIRNGSPV